MDNIPRRFLEHIFFGRKKFIEKAITGNIDEKDIILETLRHNPVVVSYGPSGLNASVKGVGFVVKEELLKETIKSLKDAAKNAKTPGERAKVLLEYIYNEDRLDFFRMITLELARKHTWENVKNGSKITLLYIIPPMISFEVRCNVKIYTSGPYWEYANILHDFYHAPEKLGKRGFPAYLLEIREIYDNSVDAFGVRVYP